MFGDRALGGVLDHGIDLELVDLEIHDDLAAKRGRHPPIHPVGEIDRQIGAVDQRLLEAVHTPRFRDEIFHGAAGNFRIGILEQRLDDVLIAEFDQRIADFLIDTLADGDRETMLIGAMTDDLDEILVMQNLAVFQHGPRDLDHVVGEQADDFGRRRIDFGKAFGKLPPDRGFDRADQLDQNVAHQGAFVVVQTVLVGDEHVVHVVQQNLTAFGRLLAGEIDKLRHLRPRLFRHIPTTRPNSWAS